MNKSLRNCITMNKIKINSVDTSTVTTTIEWHSANLELCCLGDPQASYIQTYPSSTGHAMVPPTRVDSKITLLVCKALIHSNRNSSFSIWTAILDKFVSINVSQIWMYLRNYIHNVCLFIINLSKQSLSITFHNHLKAGCFVLKKIIIPTANISLWGHLLWQRCSGHKSMYIVKVLSTIVWTRTKNGFFTIVHLLFRYWIQWYATCVCQRMLGRRINTNRNYTSNSSRVHSMRFFVLAVC